MQWLRRIWAALVGRPVTKTWMVLDDWGRLVPNSEARTIDGAIRAAETETGCTWGAMLNSGWRISWR